ncbi:hypothetical protein Glove_261g30 [Diversispora epigaea]|uniref:RING-type E3 ubiquitin transferase n=1 Tax=Diversispora epigaea TaxID=1348612 RepID=A0A397I650_9GLOM|nr:hypothetical protein Glove_261g30 [Diversispora epigaea]
MGLDTETLEGEKFNESSDSLLALDCEKSGSGISEMNGTLHSDKTNSEEIGDFQQSETNNNNGGGNIIDQGPNASAQIINQQTEILDCEHYTSEPYSSAQNSIDAPTLRQRQTSMPTLPESSKSTNNATCVTSGRSFSLNSAGEGSSRGAKNISNSKSIETNTINGGSEYECNICFDTASSPVLTLCGHLFCWPCLHQWLEAQSQNPLCPVCKAGCGQDKVIPIYGRGKEAKDPRTNAEIPNRPPGQRPQPQRDPNQPGNQFFPGSSFHTTTFGPHFSISTSTIFPSLFGAQFAFTPPNGPPSPQQAFLSRLLLMFGCLILIMFLLY